MRMPDELSAPGADETALARWTELEEAVRQYARASKAPNTVRAYRSDLGDFTMWRTDHQLTPIPATAETVAVYITALAGTGARPSTIQRRLSALSQAHQLSGHEPSPPSPRSCARPWQGSGGPWAWRRPRRRPWSPPSCSPCLR